MDDPKLESDQARWAEQCCSGGDCPVCNDRDVPPEDNCICCGDELSENEQEEGDTCFPCQKGNRECCNQTEEE